MIALTGLQREIALKGDIHHSQNGSFALVRAIVIICAEARQNSLFLSGLSCGSA